MTFEVGRIELTSSIDNDTDVTRYFAHVFRLLLEWVHSDKWGVGIRLLMYNFNRRVCDDRVDLFHWKDGVSNEVVPIFLHVEWPVVMYLSPIFD